MIRATPLLLYFFAGLFAVGAGAAGLDAWKMRRISSEPVRTVVDEVTGIEYAAPRDIANSGAAARIAGERAEARAFFLALGAVVSFGLAGVCRRLDTKKPAG